MELIFNEAHLRAALMAQAKNDIRFYLNGIYLQTNGDMVATNGHIMFLGRHCNTITEPIILSFSGSVPARFNTAVVTLRDGMQVGQVEYRGRFDKVVGFGMVTVIDGKFPDYVKIINKFKPDPVSVIRLNTDYVEIASKISKLFNPRNPNVDIETSGERNAVRVTIHDIFSGNGYYPMNSAVGNVYFYLMPVAV
jgi:DNA polymerase III sliding clamp (beta) subunit (PCNA family)